MKKIAKAFLKGVPLDVIAEVFSDLVLAETKLTPKVAAALRGLAKAILTKVGDGE